jgi:ribosomal-protein-alanine N-acetyltransferase
MHWGMALHGQDELIGSIGYYNLQSNQAEIGYDLAPRYWGQGLMTEALEALVGYCVEGLAIERLEALVLPDNERSVGFWNGPAFETRGSCRVMALTSMGSSSTSCSSAW